MLSALVHPNERVLPPSLKKEVPMTTGPFDQPPETQTLPRGGQPLEGASPGNVVTPLMERRTCEGFTPIARAPGHRRGNIGG